MLEKGRIICTAPKKLMDECDLTRYENVEGEGDFPDCDASKYCNNQQWKVNGKILPLPEEIKCQKSWKI